VIPKRDMKALFLRSKARYLTVNVGLVEEPRK
jgi:hypothetical protein